MKFSTAAATALLAGIAAAAPSTPSATDKIKHIKQLLKQLPNDGQIQPLKTQGIRSNSSKDATTYSGNWGGVVVNSNAITEVEATFTVPSVSLPSGDSTSNDYYGCAWVGIDGDDSCSNGLWQAGAYWLYSNGGWEYFPFFEWYPGGVNAADLNIAPGDSISVSVVANTDTSGTYTFTNQNSGQTVSGTLSGQPSLCQQTVEWIVEDNNGPTPVMPDFGTVTFTDARYTANGQIGGVSGGTIYAVYDNNVAYTNCNIQNDNELTCSWQD